ncbi:MAG: hypothetical protein ACI9U0_000873 [Flavobacteriales bacterium]|jgi:hypothetical protein|tara:strand:+ start:2556 stop:2765 length:210 start_codon:yes stop_codon:yes gene_type:complete
MLKPGKYRHYKNKLYQVIEVAIHSETMEEMVVYRPLYGEGKLWVRPLDVFLETVEVKGETISRFEFIET